MISRRSAIFAGGAAGLGLRSSPAAEWSARPVSDFVDSIGINVHLGEPAYAEAFVGIVLPRLRALGVRHVRDGLARDEAAAGRLATLFADAGIRATLICAPTTHTPAAAADLVSRSFNRVAVAALEGINEPDGWFRTQPSAGSDWAATTVQYQCSLSRAVKAAPGLANLPVLGPAVVDIRNVESLTGIEACSDVATIHPYPGGNHPETEGWGARERGFAYGSLDWSLANATPRLRPEQPVMVTETGYHNAVDSEGGHPGVPESVAATYLPRLFLYYFKKGTVRSFSYELLDERNAPRDAEACFGLLRWDGTPKPAFTSLQTLIALLSDPGPQPTVARRLSFTLSSARPVESVLLQKSDGDFYLAVWLADRIWDPVSRQSERSTPVKLRIALEHDLREAAMAEVDRGLKWKRLPLPTRVVEIEAAAAVKVLRLRLTD